MIVECEKCKSQFNVDDGMIKKSGSKVRCSVCKYIFIVHPGQSIKQEPAAKLTFDDDMEETVALDSPPLAKDRDAGDDALPMMDLDDLIIQEETSSVFDDSGSDLSFDESFDSGEESPSYRETSISSSMEKPGRSPAFLFILIAIFLIIGIGAGVYFYFPNLISGLVSIGKTTDKPDLKDLGIKKMSIEAQSIESYFLRSEKAGELFIIKGRVLNHYPEARSRVQLQVSIYDDKNNIIFRKKFFAGNSFTDDELKIATMEQIDTVLKKATGKNDQIINVAPNSSMPFMVIFDKLPDNAKDFSPDLVSSSPGIQS